MESSEDKSRYIARYVGTMGLIGSLHVLLGCVLWFRPDAPILLGNFTPETLGWGMAVEPELSQWSPLGAGIAFLQALLCFLSAFFYRSWSYRGVILGCHALLAALAFWTFSTDRQFLFLAASVIEALLFLWVAGVSLSLLYHKVFTPSKPAPPPLTPLTPSKANP